MTQTAYIITRSLREAAVLVQMDTLRELFRESRGDSQDPPCAFILDPFFDPRGSGVFVMPHHIAHEFVRRRPLRVQRAAEPLLLADAAEGSMPVYVICKGAVGVEQVSIAKLAPGEN